MKSTLFLVAGLALTAVVAAAQPAPPPPAPPPAAAPAGPPLTPLQARGHDLFAGSCAYCHGPRGHATALLDKRLGAGHGLLEARTDLAPDYVRFAVRHGVGGMPWYRRAELPDSDLDAVIAYLTQKPGK